MAARATSIHRDVVLASSCTSSGLTAPFNTPSSDEEKEVEKVGMGPLDRAEHGSLLGSGLADSGLYVGGRKVSTGYAHSHAHEVARVINNIIMVSSPPCRKFHLSGDSSSR